MQQCNLSYFNGETNYNMNNFLVGNGPTRPQSKFRGHFEAKDMSGTCP